MALRKKDVDHITYSTDPLSLNYMKILRYILRTVGGWPITDSHKEKHIWIQWLYTRYLVFETATLVLGEFNFIIKKYHCLNIFDLGEKILTFCISSLVLYKITLPLRKQYKNIIINFCTKFHLIYYKNKNQYNKEISDSVDRLSYYFTSIMSVASFCAMMLFNLSPMYTNYKHGVRSGYKPENYSVRFSISFIYPFYDPSEHYTLTNLLNYWFSYVCTSAVCLNDVLSTIIAFQIISHIKILKHDLEQSEEFKIRTIKKTGNINKERALNIINREFTVQENRRIHFKIKECIEHHKFIVSFTGEFSDFFGPIFGVTYLFHLFSCCLVLFQCSKGDSDALAQYGPLSVIIFTQLVQISVPFEVIRSESGKLKDSVYYLPWEYMNVSNQRSVCIFLHRVQIPIHVTAMGMASVGVQTMVAILRTTFSYFTFLQSMNQP